MTSDVLAFEHFGGVSGRVGYDGSSGPPWPGSSSAGTGRRRRGSSRWRSHHGFDLFFCIPGQQGAHEKGGVGGEIGPFRRRHLGARSHRSRVRFAPATRCCGAGVDDSAEGVVGKGPVEGLDELGGSEVATRCFDPPHRRGQDDVFGAR